jgi:hypothetical protein
MCVLNNDRTLQLIRADDYYKSLPLITTGKDPETAQLSPPDPESTVIYLDTKAGSTLTVTHRKYEP